MSFIGFILSIILFTLVAATRVVVIAIKDFALKCLETTKENRNFNRYNNIATA